MLGRLITLFDETLRILHCLDIHVLYTCQFQSGWYIICTCVVVFLTSNVLVVTILVICRFVGKNIAGGRNGVAFYLYSCYLYLTGIGIRTRFAGKVEVELGNSANQRNLDAFGRCLCFGCSNMFLYRNVGDGTRDRETCFRNFCVLWITIFLNAKSRVKADILQLLASDAAEILTAQLAFYIGTF